MNEVLISQSRVCDLLRSAGHTQKKKDDRDFFLEYYNQVPGLVMKTTNHKPAKSGTSRWYVFETPSDLSPARAEKKIAVKLGEILGLKVE